MKRFTMSLLLMLTWGAMQLSAQNGVGGSSVKMDWMQPFEAVAVDGPVKVIFSRVDEGKQMRISYDTKANNDSRDKASVDKYGVLHIRERSLREGVDSVEVYVYYQTMKSLSVSQAHFRFEQPLEQSQLDVDFSGGATGSLPLVSIDVVMNITGKCDITLEGKTRYFDLKVSTAKVDASRLECLSTRIDATHKAEVTAQATERFEASASMSQVLYGGHPSIVRTSATLGGRAEQSGNVTLVGTKE